MMRAKSREISIFSFFQIFDQLNGMSDHQLDYLEHFELPRTILNQKLGRFSITSRNHSYFFDLALISFLLQLLRNPIALFDLTAYLIRLLLQMIQMIFLLLHLIIDLTLAWNQCLGRNLFSISVLFGPSLHFLRSFYYSLLIFLFRRIIQRQGLRRCWMFITSKLVNFQLFCQCFSRSSSHVFVFALLFIASSISASSQEAETSKAYRISSQCYRISWQSTWTKMIYQLSYSSAPFPQIPYFSSSNYYHHRHD